MNVVSVDELRRAWHAVQGGQFRSTGLARRGLPPHGGTGEDLRWAPSAPVLPVLGCHGGAGTTTVAAAIASVLEVAVRVVETSPDSGLTGFATAELGETGTGWLRGQRDHLVLDRLPEGYVTPDEVPVPEDDALLDPALNVLDTGWPAWSLLRCGGWVRSAVLDADRLVVVTTATVPGLRRLEAVLDDLDPIPGHVAVAVQGPRRRRWPREVAGCAGARTRALLEGSLAEIPHDPGLAARGLDTAPLPTGVLGAATTITQLLQLASSQVHHPKGNQHVR